MSPPLRVAIFGSGFGLYGYLPMIAGTGACRILLPVRYEPVLMTRPSLAALAPQIEWCRNDEEALNSAEAFICARRAGDHRDLVNRFLQVAGSRYLIVEKPIGINAPDACALERCLSDSELIYRIGYIFRYTEWGGDFLRGFPESTTVNISWKFCSHHYKNRLNVWKRYHSQGGGALAFYGIHLIALLAEAGYDTVEASATTGPFDEVETWCAVFSGKHLPDCRILVDSIADSSEFAIYTGNAYGALNARVILTDPFADECTGSRPIDPDPRIKVLHALWMDLMSEIPTPSWYGRVINLWRDVEVKTSCNAIAKC